MSEQIVAKPAGMVTEPNKVGQFSPGAFSACKNVAIRSFGLVEQVRKFSAFFSNAFPTAVMGGVYTVADGLYTVFLVQQATTLWRLVVVRSESNGSLTSASTDFLTNTQTTSPLEPNARTGIVFMRNRIIISGTGKSFAFDIVEVPGTTTWYLGTSRVCGLWQSVLVGRSTATGTADDPAYVGPNEHFSASITSREVHSDGYELLSPAAIPYDYANLSTTLPQTRSTWTVWSYGNGSPGPALALVERYDDIYRTRSQSVGYDSINNKYLPIATGSSFYLSKSALHDDTIGVQNIHLDTTLPSGLGEALVTNVSVGGASAIPLPPPPNAKTCAVFRGHAFYANRWDPATFVLQTPFYWGTMDIATASSAVLTQGVGIRSTASGQTATSGNPTVTGLPNTTGVVSGQLFVVRRTDTFAVVSPAGNVVVSTTGTTVTGSGNMTYSGAVLVQIQDLIELNGTVLSVGSSPQEFARNIFTVGINYQRLTVLSVGLEPSSTTNPVGVYPNFVPTGGMTIRMRTSDPITLRATNGVNYSPKLPEIASTVETVPGKQQLNGFAWSENNEPENCPPSNYAFVGGGEIYKIVATRDCLWFFCSDGLFRLSGAGGSVGEEYDWVIDPVDPSLIIANPNCACVYRDSVYAMTNRGVVSISSDGVVRQLSDGRIAPTGDETVYALNNRTWINPSSATANGVSDMWNWVVADPTNDEIWVYNRNRSDEGYIGYIWVYSVKTDTWCIRQPTQFGTQMPCLAVYSQAWEMVFSVYSGSRHIYTSTYGNTGDFEEGQIKFQPFYGGAHGAPYTQKHWQDINLSFRAPQYAASTTCQVSSQGVSAGTRTIPVATDSGSQMDMSRVGFSVPRRWPAFSNTIAPEITISTQPVVGGLATPMKLEGMQISYIDTSPQRVKR